MTPEELRAPFAVLENTVYLNAGTDGPLPRQAAQAAHDELEREVAHGRTHAHFERRAELSTALRAAYAQVLGAPVDDVALTTCTSEGLAIVIGGFPFAPGDEILTSNEEHPGLLGALQTARDLYGVSIRMAPMHTLAQEVGARTRLVACSHVGWVSGSLAPGALAELEIPVLLDGAQGAGAVAVDVGALGCAAYAGSGQKWLCGPDGIGMLYVSPQLREVLGTMRRGYGSYSDPGAGLEAQLHASSARFDTLSLNAETVACALAAIEHLLEFGLVALHTRATTLAQDLAQRVAAHGRTVGPRGLSTLVSFSSSEPAAEREKLAAAGILLRDIPNTPWLRASVGAWNNEQDLTRLLAEL